MAVGVQKLFIHVEDDRLTMKLALNMAEAFLPDYTHIWCATQAAFLEKMGKIILEKKPVRLFVLLDNQFPRDGNLGCEWKNMGIDTAEKIREMVKEHPFIEAVLVSSSSQQDENFQEPGLFDAVWGK